MQELQLHHQRQLEEEARRLGGTQPVPPAVMSNSVSGTTSSNQNQKNSSNQRGSVTITKSKSVSNNSSSVGAAAATSIDETPINRMEALNAKPGTQIKITRTPTG